MPGFATRRLIDPSVTFSLNYALVSHL